MLERHRMSCHIGSPLQCGHHDCSQILVAEPEKSRGHMHYGSLRNHFELYFNQNLQSSQTQPSNPDSGLHYLSELRETQKPLPTEAAYTERFAKGSSSYLSQYRRKYRLEENYSFSSTQNSTERHRSSRQQNLHRVLSDINSTSIRP